MNLELQIRYQNTTPALTRPRCTRWVRKRTVTRASKPVNSWISFRTFYKKIFPGIPQKEASVRLKSLWKQDPFKFKWAIVSAAYSKIRDAVTRENAPLSEFLSLVCPRIGILSVEEYLFVLNWIRSVNENGEFCLRQKSAPDLSLLPDSILNTGMTGGDLVQLCAKEGFIDPDTNKKIKNTSPFIELSASNPRYIFRQDPASILQTEQTTEQRDSSQIAEDTFFYFNQELTGYNKTDDPEKQSCGNAFGNHFHLLEDSSSNYEYLLPKETSEYDIPDLSYQLFLDNLS